MVDADQCKLFVGGISWETTEDVLKEHFSKYGTVLSSVIARDKNTGVPRGFAFVTFTESSAVDRALQDSHQILNRTVEVKRAIPRSEQQNQQLHHRGSSRNYSRTNYRGNDQIRTKKIFVGGLSANLTEEDFRRYFEKFGRINDVVVMHDNMTHRPRGFGFITFDTEESAEEVMQTNFHELSGKLVEVKRAVPKDGTTSSSNGYSGRIGGGRSPSFTPYQQTGFPTYQPRFGYFPNGYASLAGYPYGTGIYSGGGYPIGNYPGISYTYAPVPPRNDWGAGGIGVRGNFLPYVNAAPVYPAYVNGSTGVVSFGGSAFEGALVDGIDMKSAQAVGVGHPQIHVGDVTAAPYPGTTSEDGGYRGSGKNSLSGGSCGKQGKIVDFQPCETTNST